MSAEHDGLFRPQGRWLTLARLVWMLIALVSVGLFIAGVPLRFQQLVVPCVGDICIDGQLAPEAVLAIQNAGFSVEGYAAFNVGIDVMVAFVYCSVGLVIFWRQSREWMALIASLWLVTLGVTFGEGEYRALAASYPGLEPLTSILIYLGGVVLLALFLYIFPTGRFVPRWSRWVYLATMIFFLLFGALELFWPQSYAIVEPSGGYFWGAMILVGVGAQAYRYRRFSSPIERQQTKWVMFGLLVVVLGIVAFIFLDVGRLPISDPILESAANFFVQTTIGSLVFMLIPVTIGFSILRYRLWDTDIIINRTLVYGLLTAVLALLYISSVVLFQQVTQALTGQSSPLAIVASTLLVAALFSPLRRRLQNLIDRRFYRRKYDAAQTLVHFAQVAQEEVDLKHLAGELLAAVQQSMQPERVSLWLKEQEHYRSPE